MNPSETVKAAQRLLAEREAVGLKKYGTTVDRADLEAGDWLQHAIEEASDLLLYLIRLRETMQPAPAAAPEDAERAAYLARWANAPEWAQWLAQDPDGRCDFFESMPSQDDRGVWMLPNDIDFYSGAERFAGHDILGPFRCESRPVQGVGE